MAALTITRTAMTDDDGTGTTGTVFNNAWKTSVYDQIDGLFSTFGGHAIEAGGTGGNTVTVRNTTAGTSNYAAMFVGTDASATQAYLQAFSSTFTTSGSSLASGASLVCEGAGGISLVASNASGDIRFYAAGTTLISAFKNALAADNGLFIANGKNLHVGNITRVGRGTTNPTNAINLYPGTLPVGTMTGGLQIYAKDSGAGLIRLYYMDSGGTERGPL